MNESEKDWSMEPTSEYTMRHAANLLSRTFGHGTPYAASLDAEHQEVINFAYQQLVRGANTIRQAQAAAWDEGAEADADAWCLTAIPCGDCANCTGPEIVNPYKTADAV